MTVTILDKAKAMKLCSEAAVVPHNLIWPAPRLPAVRGNSRMFAHPPHYHRVRTAGDQLDHFLRDGY